MKKNILLIVVLGIILITVLGVLIFVPGKTKPAEIQTGIIIASLKAGEEVATPLKITGYANGDGWVGFEGQVGTVQLLDSKGDELAFGIIQATTDWMVAGPVYFETNLSFVSEIDDAGTLVFVNENPSGLSENSRTLTMPVKIKAIGETQTVKVYFNYQGMDPVGSCNDVMAIERVIPKTQAVARAAIEELLRGPTDREQMLGWYSSINPGVKIQSLVIDANGIAKIDFDEQLEFQVGGSCRVSAISAQISQTLKQFPTVKNVVISINGRTEDILQP